ncbi:PREDICTED: uncharacterized protein LOC102872672 [Elephantulus edwardii]|uniref:uncharacterized protein LOC102872672 n=1 Tax=Elephantulus edwardii TaxID=28737 RepID=UPI0003F0BBF5|nr:PREDICTED: uncharacterized protein LOC102872672 [Elephantulus edwardii]
MTHEAPTWILWASEELPREGEDPGASASASWKCPDADHGVRARLHAGLVAQAHGGVVSRLETLAAVTCLAGVPSTRHRPTRGWKTPQAVGRAGPVPVWPPRQAERSHSSGWAAPLWSRYHGVAGSNPQPWKKDSEAVSLHKELQRQEADPGYPGWGAPAPVALRGGQVRGAPNPARALRAARTAGLQPSNPARSGGSFQEAERSRRIPDSDPGARLPARGSRAAAPPAADQCIRLSAAPRREGAGPRTQLAGSLPASCTTAALAEGLGAGTSQEAPPSSCPC